MNAHGAENKPHTAIPYTGIREGAARFEDYSAVDGSVLKKNVTRERSGPWRWR